jgi:sec-independent protein translocase protein TatA
MPFGIGPGELIVVLIIALLVIGPGKLPDVGAALGKSIREFRKASSDVEEATRIDTSPIPPTPAAPVPPVNAPSAPVEPNVLHTPSAPPASDTTADSNR